MAADTYVGTIRVEFVSSDPESAARQLNGYARPICESISSHRIEITGPTQGTLEHRHVWRPSSVWDTGHNPPKQRYDCTGCDESEWMDNEERDALEATEVGT